MKSSLFTHFEQDDENGDLGARPYQLLVIQAMHEELPVLILIEDQQLILSLQVQALTKNKVFGFLKDKYGLTAIKW